MSTTASPPDQLLKEAERLKSYFPFRIIVLATHPEHGQGTWADHTRRRANKMAREGWTVWTLN